MTMDLETFNKASDLRADITRLNNYLKNIEDFLVANGKNTLISSIKAEIKRLEQEFEDLQPKPKPTRNANTTAVANRLDWLNKHYFILSDGTHSSADGKVKSNYNDFIIKIGRELIIASPELINDFEEYTDLAGNVTSRWNTMVQKYRKAVAAYKERDHTPDAAARANEIFGIKTIFIDDDCTGTDYWYSTQIGKEFKVKTSSRSHLKDTEGFFSKDPLDVWVVTDGEWAGCLILKKHTTLK